MAGTARNRLRAEHELREAEAIVARAHEVSLDESAQALKDTAEPRESATRGRGARRHLRQGDRESLRQRRAATRVEQPPP